MRATLATMAFYAKNQGWQTFSKIDPSTKRAVKRLESLGYLEVIWANHQARHTGKVFQS